MPFNPVERPFLWQHLTASTQVITTRCVLHTVTINHPDAAAGAMVTLHDVAAVGDIAPGNMIANIALDSALFVIPNTLIYDVGCTNGLYALFSAGLTTADITVSYV